MKEYNVTWFRKQNVKARFLFTFIPKLQIKHFVGNGTLPTIPTMPTIPTVPTMGPNSSTPNKGMPTHINPRFMSAFQ